MGDVLSHIPLCLHDDDPRESGEFQQWLYLREWMCRTEILVSCLACGMMTMNGEENLGNGYSLESRVMIKVHKFIETVQS